VLKSLYLQKAAVVCLNYSELEARFKWRPFVL